MNRVNLKEYPRFWTDFVDRINREIDPSTTVSSYLVKQRILDWYGINVHIMSYYQPGEVYMLDPDYTAFVLRWA